jgi:hypothetical protein
VSVAVLTFVGAYVLVELSSRAAITRAVGRELARLFIFIELFAQALVRLGHPPRFVLDGRCHRRGVCCAQIVFAPPQFVRSRPYLLQLMLLFHRVAHDFHPVGTGPSEEIIFRCGHILPSGSCGIYTHRPLLCRDYPALGYYEAPALLPGCGYVAVPRVVKKMKARPALRILNPTVAVHHPTPPFGEEDSAEHYELVDPY